MSTIEHDGWLLRAVQAIKTQVLRGLAYKTVSRREISDICRAVRGEPDAKLGSEIARRLDTRLLEEGIATVPPLADANDWDYVRLIRTGTFAHSLSRLWTHPTPDGDREIAHILTKLKGRWQDSPDDLAA